MLEMQVPDHTGHSKHIWDIDKPDEVAAAKALFDTLKGKGYVGLYVNADGSDGSRMDEFQPKAGKLVMVPHLKGG